MQQQTANRHPRTLEEQIEALPPVSDTVNRVMEVVNDPESSSNDLMKAVLPDQAMCLAILKLANSAFYGRQAKVNSIETAITVLGFSEVQNIVLGKAALTAFKPVIRKYQQELQSYWDHCFTCGLAAKNIAEQLNQPPGPFFMAGMLHDLGKLAILLTYGDRYEPDKRLHRFSSETTIREEKQEFSISHDTIGGYIMEKWQFPQSLIIALQHHHAPAQAPKMQKLAMIIQLADFLAHMYAQPEELAPPDLMAELNHSLPDFVSNWQQQQLPWQETTLETWYAFLKVDRAHGNAVLDILAS